jgi:hypothetical protein
MTASYLVRENISCTGEKGEQSESDLIKESLLKTT